MGVGRHIPQGDFVFRLAAAGSVEVDFVDFDALLLVKRVQFREVLLEDGHHLFVVGDDDGIPRLHDAAGCRQQHHPQQKDGSPPFHIAFPCR